MNLKRSLLTLIAVPWLAPALTLPYPLDGYERTKIRRLEAYRRVQTGELSGTRLPPGAMLGDADIVLRLAGVNDTFELTADTPRDAYLQEGIESIFRGRNRSYSIAVLDITDPTEPKYAGLREHQTYAPGSIGKLVVMTGIFAELARIWTAPGDRLRVLRDTQITAESIINTDSHSVPVVDLERNALVHRPIRIGDVFSLWEWVDHMASPSSNAAASTTWREAMYLARFGDRYPVSPEEEQAYFRDTSKVDLQQASVEVINAPLRRMGIAEEEWRQGTFFTRAGQNLVPGVSSHASPFALLQWLVKIEQGKAIDPWSSLEMKKLLYFTRRRYRYASSPALNEAAVYFKSGSLYSCRPEAGFQCGQYRGNRLNFMNSVAIVESPAGSENSRVYIVALMSNVLKTNSAVEHQTIATLIERLIENRPDSP